VTAAPLTTAQKLRRLALMALGSEELRHLEEAAWLAEQRAAEHHTAALADIWWGPALGAFPRRRRSFPSDAPPLPTRRDKP